MVKISNTQFKVKPTAYYFHGFAEALHATKEKIVEFKGANRQLKSKLDETQRKLDETKHKLDETRQELDEIQQVLEDLETHNNRLELKIAEAIENAQFWEDRVSQERKTSKSCLDRREQIPDLIK